MSILILVDPNCPDVEEDHRRNHYWHCILPLRLDELLVVAAAAAVVVVVAVADPFAGYHHTIDRDCFPNKKSNRDELVSTFCSTVIYCRVIFLN